MDKIKLAIGTTSSQKLGYLQEVLNEIGCVADIIPVEVESGIPDQPLSEKNTKKGSANRAKDALKKSQNARCEWCNKQ